MGGIAYFPIIILDLQCWKVPRQDVTSFSARSGSEYLKEGLLIKILLKDSLFWLWQGGRTLERFGVMEIQKYYPFPSSDAKSIVLY